MYEDVEMYLFCEKDLLEMKLEDLKYSQDDSVEDIIDNFMFELKERGQVRRQKRYVTTPITKDIVKESVIGLSETYYNLKESWRSTAYLKAALMEIKDPEEIVAKSFSLRKE